MFLEVGAVIRLTSGARAGWFEIRTATSGSGGTWMLPEGTRLRYVGIRNGPPIGSDPMPVAHFEVLEVEHAGSIVTASGLWFFETTKG